MPEYLHNHKEFSSLINIIADEKKIEAGHLLPKAIQSAVAETFTDWELIIENIF